MLKVEPFPILLFIECILSVFSFQEFNTQKELEFLKQPTIHIISHSHQDIGWRKTVEGYFYGLGESNNNLHGYSKRIYDNILKELMFDSKLRFVAVEMAYFSLWYEQISWENQEIVRDLVQQGRLEIANGGWVMCDGLITYFEDIIDQFTLGHNFIHKTFNLSPKVAWQIDPFGHSQIYAALLVELGMSSIFLSRIPNDDKLQRIKSGQLEFVWHPKRLTNYDFSLSVHVTKDHYTSLKGTCFDNFACFDQIKEMKERFDKDLKISLKVQDAIQEYKSAYTGKNAFLFFGDDFAFEYAFQNFDSMRNVIKMVEKTGKKKFNYRFSTPSEYLMAFNQEELPLATYVGDFQPYVQKGNEYWTGFYTTRPQLKYQIFKFSRVLSNIRSLIVDNIYRGKVSLGDLFISKIMRSINYCSQIQATMLHHDAITGTSVYRVYNDYTEKLSNVTNTLNSLYSQFIFMGQPPSTLISCDLFGRRFECPNLQELLLKSKSIEVMVYNPGKKIEQVLQIPIPHQNFTVTSSQKNDSIPQETICASVLGVNCLLFFKTILQPFQHSFFQIQNDPNNTILPQNLKSNNLTKEDSKNMTRSKPSIFVKNGSNKQKSCQPFIFINHTVTLQCLGDDFPDKNFTFILSYYEYSTKNMPSGKGGHYIFEPIYLPEEQFDVYESEYYNGSLVKQLILKSNTTISIVQIFPHEVILNKRLKFEIITDLLPQEAKLRQSEIVLRIKIQDSEAPNQFIHDQNGLEFISRDPAKHNLEVNKHYYPITTAIGANITQLNSTGWLYILNDRSQGGTMYNDSTFEIMLNRVMIQDDSYGLGQTLIDVINDKLEGVTTHHQVIYDFSAFNSIKRHDTLRQNQIQRDKAPIINFYQTKDNPYIDNVRQSILSENPFLTFVLYPLNPQQFMLRVTNMKESEIQTFNLLDKFPGYKYERTTLSGNQKYDEIHHKRFTWKQMEKYKYSQFSQDTDNQLSFKIQPLQTKAFKFTKLVLNDYE